MQSRMYVAGGSLLVICLTGWWLSRPLATDVLLRPMPTASDLDGMLWSTFDGAPIDTLGEQHKNVDTENGFTHIRLRYSAPRPFVVTVNPSWIVENRYAFNAAERVGAVLPAAQDATVTLPVSASVGWKRGTRQAIVYAYAESAASPRLLNMEPFSAGLGLRQILTPEAWTLASVNFLRGYRVAGVSLAVLLGMAMIIAMFVLRRNYGDMNAALLAGAFAVLLFFIRSGTDLLSGTLGAVVHWQQSGTLSELGDVVAIARDLKGDERTIAACGYSDAPVAYGIFPAKLAPVQEADIAVLPTAWTLKSGGVLCGTSHIDGTVVRTYPAGGGIAELHSAPSAQ